MQSVGVKPEQGGGAAAQSKNLAKGLCVACSPDGYMVVVGCSDATVRTFAQDTTGLRRAVHVRKNYTRPSGVSHFGQTDHDLSI